MTLGHRIPAILAAAAAAMTVAACGIFGGGGKDTAEPPAELVPLENSIRIRREWSGRVGGGSERLRLGLRPATDGARIYAGSNGGQVVAFDAETGRSIWTVKTGVPLISGPGLGDGSLVFGTGNGDLLALDAEDGEQLWRVPVGSEVLAAPAIGRDVVVFNSIDGRLRGFTLSGGEPLWSIQRNLPALTVRGNTAPYVTGPIVVSGFDNGRVAAFEITSGDRLWDVTIGSSTGRNELERLVDIGLSLQVVGNDAYAVGYQGRAVSIDLRNGLVIWQREVSSYAGLGVDFNNVYITSDVDAVVALDRRRGTELWRQEALRLRDLTAPTRFGDALVVGDFEGYLHWLSPDDGHFLARERGASARISAPPLVIGSKLYIQADDGTVAAYSVVDASG